MPLTGSVPPLRVAALNQAPPRPDRDYVLYWMTANRRPHSNFALDRAIDWARELGRPLLVLEALRCDYQWASDRLHAFVVQGMADNQRAFAGRPVTYYPYVEPRAGAGRGLIEALAKRAAVIVTDDFPCFFLPRMLAAAAARIDVLVEAIDSNGLLPMRAADRVYPTAFAFRRFLHKQLPLFLDQAPRPDPLSRLRLPGLPGLPPTLARTWPPASESLLAADPTALAALPIDHAVGIVPTTGGHRAAVAALGRFLAGGLDRYAELRNQPDDDATSGLSPYLHFGHISAHEILAAITAIEQWSPARLSRRTTGSREGWWGMSPAAEGLLDQLVTWRELGYNMCWQRTDHDRYESLPAWALESLELHAGDERPTLYDFATLDAAATHDEIWNAAQRQLRGDGRMHNYLRMLWGKKILEWSTHPREALAAMIELNNRYALDGRNPNSYSGIFWILGRYDRAWGPEREIFGKIRYMSSANTARKLHLKEYLARHRT